MSFIVVSSYYKIMIYLHESQGANPIGKALVHSISIQLFTYSWNPTKLLQSNFISAVIKGGKHWRRKRGGGICFGPPPIIQTCLGKWSLKYHNVIRTVWKSWSFQGLRPLDPRNNIILTMVYFMLLLRVGGRAGHICPPPNHADLPTPMGNYHLGLKTTLWPPCSLRDIFSWVPLYPVSACSIGAVAISFSMAPNSGAYSGTMWRWSTQDAATFHGDLSITKSQLTLIYKHYQKNEHFAKIVWATQNRLSTLAGS